MISPPRLASPPGLSVVHSTLLARLHAHPAGRRASTGGQRARAVPAAAAESCCSALRSSRSLGATGCKHWKPVSRLKWKKGEGCQLPAALGCRSWWKISPGACLYKLSAPRVHRAKL